MQKQLGPKTQIPKVSAEPSSSVQDDIEIEVVEALFDLMKQSQSLSQSQCSKKFEKSSDNNSTAKFGSTCNKAVDDNSSCSSIISAKIVIQASDLQQEISFPSSPLLDVGKCLADLFIWEINFPLLTAVLELKFLDFPFFLKYRVEEERGG